MIVSNVFVIYALITIVVAIAVSISKLELTKIETLSFTSVWNRFISMPYLGRIVFFVWLLSKVCMLGIVGVTMSMAPQYIPWESPTIDVGVKLNSISCILAVLGGYFGDKILITLSKKLGLDISKEYETEKASSEADTTLEDILNEEDTEG
ncbi:MULTISPECIES: hypothetical protein [unclassified Psychrobacillus]|uniref:hypothetical protein n=1 Tax=unclassified Psychrobacillus TaxID=2636677 RepID=UPI0030F6DC31